MTHSSCNLRLRNNSEVREYLAKNVIEVDLFLEIVNATPIYRLGELNSILPYKIYTLEPSEDAINYGRYKITFNKQDTPLTIKYRNLYSWFTYHIEIIVPHRRNIYIHKGNTVDDSDGCIIVGNSTKAYTKDSQIVESVINSEFTYKAIYPVISELINKSNDNLYLNIV
jgi:hypothetical protein